MFVLARYVPFRGLPVLHRGLLMVQPPMSREPLPLHVSSHNTARAGGSAGISIPTVMPTTADLPHIA